MTWMDKEFKDTHTDTERKMKFSMSNQRYEEFSMAWTA
jgi:hypothetical protein